MLGIYYSAPKYFWPGCHNMEPYKTLQPDAGMMLPVTEEVSERIVALPTGTAMDEEMIGHILRFLSDD